MVGVADGEQAIFGTLAVEIPLRIFVHESYLARLNSSGVTRAEIYR